MIDNTCIEMWDLSGDKEYQRYLDVYIRQNMNDFSAIFYCFDVFNIKSLLYFDEWMEWLKEIADETC